jgi:hypothetical protein
MEETVRFHALFSFNPDREVNRDLHGAQNLPETCGKENNFAHSQNLPAFYLVTILTELRYSKLNFLVVCETQRNLPFLLNV